MVRYKLRTLLILLAVLPPVVATIAPTLVQWFQHEPPPLPAATANAFAPYFAFYATGPADPQFAENATRTLMAGTQVNIQLDSKTGKLVVWGPPSAHKSVQAIIGELQRGAYTVTTRKDGSVLIETERYRNKK